MQNPPDIIYTMYARVGVILHMHMIGASLSEPLLDELAGEFLWYIYICIHGQSIWSHDVGQMGKKVSDFVLCFSSRFAYSEAAKVWPIYRRRIVPSNGRLMWR